MKGVCPDCGYSAELLGFTTDAEARATISLLAEIPGELQPLVLRYLSLHRPAQRVLGWPKASKLLLEIAGWLRDGELRRKGRPWSLTHQTLAQGITEVLARRESGGLRLPLSGNGYLAEVLVGMRDALEARAERATEERLRGATPVALHPSHKPVGAPLGALGDSVEPASCQPIAGQPAPTAERTTTHRLDKTALRRALDKLKESL